MADQKPGKPRNLRTSVKGPLMFSAFWAVLAFVAVLIFGLGGGISFYEGIQHIRHPEPLHDPSGERLRA